MGLCKCPRKKVTNLFCFEHRVNVCEHCLVKNHEKCVVQSYLEWLQDSDYDPSCTICKKEIGQGSEDVIRLCCLHLFHWECFENLQKSLPANTAPAGYRCHTCNGSAFPKAQQAGPVAETLRERLKNSNWARAGLGLPLLPEVDAAMASSAGGRSAQPTAVDVRVHQSQTNGNVPGGAPSATLPSVPPQPEVVYHGLSDTQQHQHHHHPSAVNNTVLTMDDGGVATMVRKGVSTTTTDEISTLIGNQPDTDLAENKYKRKSAWELLTRWLRSRSGAGGALRVDPLTSYKRLFFLLLLAIIALMTLITVLTRVAASTGERHDPLLDPFGNPNIRIGAEDPADPDRWQH